MRPNVPTSRASAHRREANLVTWPAYRLDLANMRHLNVLGFRADTPNRFMAEFINSIDPLRTSRDEARLR